MGKLRKGYAEEISVIQEVVEALEETLRCDDTEFEIITDAGTPNEYSRWVSREEHLEFMCEYAINELSGKVGYLFQNEKSAKK